MQIKHADLARSGLLTVTHIFRNRRDFSDAFAKDELSSTSLLRFAMHFFIFPSLNVNIACTKTVIYCGYSYFEQKRYWNHDV